MRVNARQLALEQLMETFAVVHPEAVVETEANQARTALYQRFAERMVVNPELSRSLVSFQANKEAPFYRWFKYKEGFSAEFVSFLLERFGPPPGQNRYVLDPFGGAGTTLMTAAYQGWHATGIELMPVGIQSVQARLAATRVDQAGFQSLLRQLEADPLVWVGGEGYRFPHLRITQHAFPQKTEEAFAAYHAFLDMIQDPDLRFLFWFAWFAVLEEISYTRKDGQYLRWDARSQKAAGSTFHKGPIYDLKTAVQRKLSEMLEDMQGRHNVVPTGTIELIQGSCLSQLPLLPADRFDLLITSPPYCNRYDYTRTYALELAFLGYGEEAVKNLRQTLLSATVENKSKQTQLAQEYGGRGQEGFFQQAVAVFQGQEALHEVLGLLAQARADGSLNNNNIPDMVENYFFEMNLVIHEIARVLAPGGSAVIVNDNVQYIGEEVPVDLILSDFAEEAGLTLKHIWVLPRGKGNSSQQMGAHGRNEIRKCVYVWSKV